jgi:Tfp pilus assembly PilM family ATPase
MEGIKPVNRDKYILGIHIDDDFINIVYLEQTVPVPLVHCRTCESLRADTVKNGLIVNTESVAQKIRDFIKTNHITTHKAVFSLSCSTVRLKPSEFETQTDEHLKNQVEEQVGKYGLFGDAEIVFDYCVFAQTNESSDKQTVLQAVTTRKISDACLMVAKKSGLELVRIEPAVLPMMKLVFDKKAAGSVSLLLVLDSTSANLSAFRNGVPQLCQNLTIGVKDLLQAKDGFARLAGQMKNVLEFANSLADSPQIVLRVAAACDDEKLETIIKGLRGVLRDLEIEKINASQIAGESNVQGAYEGKAPIFALASALTHFGITAFNGQLNLISLESLAMMSARKEMSLTAKAVAAVILLSVAVLFPLKMKIKSVEASSADVEMKLTETIITTEKTARLKKQAEQFDEKLSIYDAADKKLTYIPWTKVLHAIGDAVPDRVRIVEILTSDNGDCTVIGESLAERYIYKFVKELQDDELIKTAKVEEIEYDNNNAANIVSYKISCSIKLREDGL